MYLIRLCEVTREHPQVALGISPRGIGALAQMSKAYALCHGRDFVTPEDVLEVYQDCCVHRLLLNSKAKREGATPETVLAQIAKETDKPKLLRRSE